jgi:hypothetical protein
MPWSARTSSVAADKNVRAPPARADRFPNRILARALALTDLLPCVSGNAGWATKRCLLLLCAPATVANKAERLT